MCCTAGATIAPIEIGVYGGLKVVCPTAGTTLFSILTVPFASMFG